jgi:hypothetical protein
MVNHLRGGKEEGRNSSKRIRVALGPMCVIINITMIGCRPTKVPLSNYDPFFTEHYGLYKGKPIYHMNFNNQLNDTSIWYYHSLGKKFSYSLNDTIHNNYKAPSEVNTILSGFLIS